MKLNLTSDNVREVLQQVQEFAYNERYHNDLNASAFWSRKFWDTVLTGIVGLRLDLDELTRQQAAQAKIDHDNNRASESLSKRSPNHVITAAGQDHLNLGENTTFAKIEDFKRYVKLCFDEEADAYMDSCGRIWCALLGEGFVSEQDDADRFLVQDVRPEAVSRD